MNDVERTKYQKAKGVALLLADMPELETDADDVEHWTEEQLYDWLDSCNYTWTGERWEYNG